MPGRGGDPARASSGAARAAPAAPERATPPPSPLRRTKDSFSDGAPPPEWDGFSGEDTEPGALGPPPPDWAAAHARRAGPRAAA